ncbi:hypothetical protein DNTS_021007 [Danionella cerebrum]|uniref:Uncharacterized protein n=1 Tax=Danionella cerebrum TaxID=2873325 RepID=A0A553QWI6_9TELE|nr:hypothetical protein DNTS_021007 [Danionella translucida]
MAGVLGGALPPQGPLHPGPLPSRLLHPDELHQNHFYTPIVQPLFPYQWSGSLLSMPYGGFHSLGYGMMPLLHSSCFEVPGYMTPTLPMFDYRRVGPYVVTPAHLTRHSNFQEVVPLGRAMVSSEVQTEPVFHHHGDTERSDTCSESGRDTGCESPASTTPRSCNENSLACQEGTTALTQNSTNNAVGSTDVSAKPKNEVLQSEQLNIQCSVVTSKVTSIQNKKISSVTSLENARILRSSLASEQSPGGLVVCSYRSLALREDRKRVEDGMVKYTNKRSLSSCTEVNVVRTPSCKTYPEQIKSVVIENGKEMAVQAMGKEDGNSPNIYFKVLRLPFDDHSHDPDDQTCQVDASIWSVDSLFPYVPSKEWLGENGLLTPQNTLSSIIEHNGIISKPIPVTVEGNQHLSTSAKRKILPSPLEASIWSVESLMPYVPSNTWLAENGLLTPQKMLRSLTEPHSKQFSVPTEKNQQTGGPTKCNILPSPQDASIWSVESLMPYVPSKEWMTENGFSTPLRSMSPQQTSCNVLSEVKEPSMNGSIRIKQQTNTIQYGSCQLDASVWSVESLMPYIPSEQMVEKGFKNKPMTPKNNPSNLQSLLHKASVNKIQQEVNKLETGVSTEGDEYANNLQTGSPYCPSKSWLADLGNVYFYSKLPLGQQSGVSEKQPNSFHCNNQESSLKNENSRNQRLATALSSGNNCLPNKCHAKISTRLTVSPKTCHLVSCSTLEKKSFHKRRSVSNCTGCIRDGNAEHGVFQKKKPYEVICGSKNLPPVGQLTKCRATHETKTRHQARTCKRCPSIQAGSTHDKCMGLKWRNLEKSSEEFLVKNDKRLQQRSCMERRI